jgi:D-alanine-D-alanine ligase
MTAAESPSSGHGSGAAASPVSQPAGAPKGPPQSAALGKVGVLFGGRSTEREISLRSGAAVLRALREAGVDAHAFDPATGTLAQLEAAGFARVFLILHGRYGEDGAIQGVLETLRIPYTGSGIQASAIAMDKITTKKIWQTLDLPTPAWTRLDRGDPLPPELSGLGPCLVVKPVSEGSTFGVSKVRSSDQGALHAAVQEALRYDRHVLIEECIRGRELTCAVLGEGPGARALPLVEIRAPEANYDYHNKYFGNQTQYLCPAPLDEALAQHIGTLCVRAYQAIGARGWGRIDVMLRREGDREQPYLLELNTAPGMTDHSLVPMAARVAGMEFPELVLRILADARLEIGA